VSTSYAIKVIILLFLLSKGAMTSYVSLLTNMTLTFH